ncbi:MAG TPA: hypothetical protein VIJ75_12960 [Hanamia sp.]
MIDRRFDMMDFEQSLKDHADQFRLTPSKRVWNGIYNNLHPGSRWPSMTMGIVFILTLLSIGYLNNSSKKSTLQESSVKIAESKSGNSKPANSINFDLENNSSSGLNQKSFKDNDPKQSTSSEKLSINRAENEKLNVQNHSKTGSGWSSLNKTNRYSENVGLPSNAVNNAQKADHATDDLLKLNPDAQSLPSKSNSISILPENLNLFVKEDDAITIKNSMVMSENFNNIVALVTSVDQNPSSSRLQLNSYSAINTHLQQPGKTFSKKIHRRWSKKIEWIYYITPTISTASFDGSDLTSSPINYSPLVVFQRSTSNGMIYNAKLGFETGAKMTYALSEKWKLLTGFNLNYSDYNIVSNPIHPTFATLTLKNMSTGALYSKNYITFYGDGQSYGQIGLTNYNLQFSIPLGIEYQVWGNQKMQINIASAVEPSVVLQSNSYIISSDKRNYVQDPELMRKMNLGGNFGAFISFGSNKIKWHIGPDVYYQLLSTYKSEYTGKEHLINYGIRIGISKKY